jgi:proteic killer suppression protein
MDIGLAHQRPRQLNTATNLQALSALNSVGLHKLKGDRRGLWSIDIKAGWRIHFRFADGNAHDVEILDPH